MGKFRRTRKFNKRRNKSKRNNKNNTTVLAGQIAGSKFTYNTLLSGGDNSILPPPMPSQSGGAVPAPAPVGFPNNLLNVTSASLSNALQQFGDAVNSLNGVASSEMTAAASAVAATAMQQTSATSLSNAIKALSNAYMGGPDGTPTGLYKTLLTVPYVATPAPAPA